MSDKTALATEERMTAECIALKKQIEKLQRKYSLLSSKRLKFIYKHDMFNVRARALGLPEKP